MKPTLLLCTLALLFSITGCGGKKNEEPLDPAAVLEARLKAAEKFGDPVTQAEEYLGIARDQQQAKQATASQKPLKLAGTAIGKITKPADKGQLAAELAILYARAKQTAESQSALEQAQGALPRIKDDPLVKAQLQARIAVAQHELGSKQTAAASLKAAATAAGAITDVESQTRAWLGVATAAKTLDDSATQQSASEKALAAAKTAPTPRQQSELMIELARTQHELGLKPAAEETLKTALTTAEQIEDSLNRGYVLLEAAGTRILWGDADQAKALIEQLEKYFETIADKDQVKQLQAKVKTQRSQLAKLKKS